MLLDISLQSSTQSSYAHHLHISRQKSFEKKGKKWLTLPSQPSLNPCSQLCPYRSHADSSMHYSSHASLYIVFLYLEHSHFNPGDEKNTSLYLICCIAVPFGRELVLTWPILESVRKLFDVDQNYCCCKKSRKMARQEMHL